jgi:hypothetical protein
MENRGRPQLDLYIEVWRNWGLKGNGQLKVEAWVDKPDVA